MNRTSRKWTAEEDEILLQQVKSLPQNLSRCFLAVSERTGRTQQAVSNRWYTHVSKQPNSVCFFTASPKTHLQEQEEWCRGGEQQKHLATSNASNQKSLSL